MLGFELGQQLIDIMYVPWPIDLGQHYHIELVADRAHDLRHVVERPRRSEAVNAGPQPGGAEVDIAPHLDECLTRRELRLRWHAVPEVAEHQLHLAREAVH